MVVNKMANTWFRSFITSAIENIEQRKQQLIYWLFSFAGIILLRMYIEDFSAGGSGEKGFFNIINQVHEFLFFIVLFAVIAIILSLATREDFIQIGKVIVVFSPVILIAPVIDLLVTGGRGLVLTYVYDFSTQGFLSRFFTLGGEWSNGGATPGMKVQVLFILVFVFLFIWAKTNKIIRSIISSFIFYCCLGALASLPFWADGYYGFFGIEVEGNHTIWGSKIFLLIIFIFGIILFFRFQKRVAQAIFSEMRITRLMFYLIMLAMGFSISLVMFTSSKLTPDLIVDIILAIGGVLLSSIFLIMVNDIEDLKIDRITNPSRILPSGQISVQSYKLIGFISLFIALIFSLAVSLEIFFLILLGNFLFVIYSVYPFKLKQNLIFSKVLTGGVAVVIMTIGFLLNGVHCSAFLPLPLLAAVFLYTLVISCIFDLKDYEGDKKVGIRTLPVRLNPKRAKILISFLLFVVFILITIIFKQIEYWPYSIASALLISLLIFKKLYNEKLVFIGIFISLIYFIYIASIPLR